MVIHDCEMKMKHCKMSWVTWVSQARLGSQVLTTAVLLSKGSQNEKEADEFQHNSNDLGL
jgi:hypothetical protein